jgi:uncharacterized protein with HEPN domain
MPSKRSPRAALLDIAENIRRAQVFLEGMEYDAFCEDARTVYAVTRCLEIILEASRRLPDEMKERHPHIFWSGIAGAGNVYRHDYEDVRESTLWYTVQRDLSPLLQVVDLEITMLPEERVEESDVSQ